MQTEQIRTLQMPLTGLLALDANCHQSWLNRAMSDPEYQLLCQGAEGDKEALRAAERLRSAQSLKVRRISRDGWMKLGSLAVIPVVGTIQKDGDYWTRWGYGTSVRDMAEAVAEAENEPGVKRLAYYFDSPGGYVDGTAEGGETIARGKKPKFGIVSGMATSAAYWLAAQTDEIVVTPESDTGSIGVRMAHTNASAFYERIGIKITDITTGKFKAAGAPWRELSEDELAYFQNSVNESLVDFRAAVARGRGARLTTEALDSATETAAVYSARTALSMGLIDAIAPVGDVLDALK